MRALLLAAGKATRLGAVSLTTPKCLHRIGDEILLDRIVRQLREVGVTEFLINTHHRAEQIVAHIDSRADRDHFTLVYETELLGTLGTLRENINFFGERDGWVLHADNFIDGSLRGLRDDFLCRPAGVWGSVLTFVANDPTSCGVVLANESRVVTGFYEKVANPPSNQASAATFLFAREVFKFVSEMPAPASDVSSHLLPLLTGRIRAVPSDGCVIDIGTPDGLRDARRRAVHTEVPRFGAESRS